ncbi:MAG: RDD family protein [Verrucomicrobia bacterium]|nr:MAG: RDD family protein [Verrucomicrobiota bacterium]
MNWYYVENGQQAGPVDDSQLSALAQAGRLSGDTLVWRDGLASWQPFSAVCPPELAGVIAGAAPATNLPPMADAAVCAECGNVYNKGDMIPHGSNFICANCKPAFMQKLAEGVKIGTGSLEYASFGTRFGAHVIDSVLLFIVNSGLGLVFGASMVGAASRNSLTGVFLAQGILLVIEIGIAMSYETIMIGKYGATLGKMACKIKVVTPDGGRVSYARACGRYFGKILSSLTCLIGFIMAAFDKEEHRALHDRICNTRVVLK